jgi:UDP-N-acetyl-D-glucosamine/UDP-N-acetyl-D-galactosamine dehydrogenase
MNFKVNKICIIGLGYVGLPLLVEFSKYYKVIGFDTDNQRVKELNDYFDRNNEFEKSELKKLKNFYFTHDPNYLIDCNIYIITVPTPVKKNNAPDLKPLEESSKLVGKFLKKKDIVIYESTVFPGCTEEVCVPILEKYSKLTYNKDFFCGYSPERINFGDKKYKLTNIKKVTSGSNAKISNIIDKLYSKIIKVGTYKAESIIIAEAAKVIENTQRDLNIAFINELSIIFDKLKINTSKVLKAAGSKWNFLNFKPGLVGGHCIGVDPYYLTYKSKKVGYNPKLILRGRSINDEMPKFIFNKIKKLLKKKNKVLFLGASFKENIPDFRNSKSLSLFKLIKKNYQSDLVDPLIDTELFFKSEKLKISKKISNKKYDAVIVAVKHDKIKDFGLKKIMDVSKKNLILIDLFNLFNSKYNKFEL